ncbi:MAG: hypothetical protein A2029_08435 [Chloroflexi bacterium RBG_19FT_COMBO_47_9]|nr:MAG: hypothetical protein A2029_08435 [Chloroflexi bacterium RBG_19FT_COMBO_47_9]
MNSPLRDHFRNDSREDNLERLNVLIVEEESIALSLKIKLEAMGYAVSVYTSRGETVLQAIAKYYPDIVLIDILLADQLMGMETAAHIQKIYNIPVIFLISHLQESILQQVKAANPDGYLLSPFRDHDLHAAIEMGLHKHAQEYLLRVTKRTLRENEERLDLTVSDLIQPVDDKTTRMIGSQVDLTERKLMELEIEKYREHLEDLVEERTVELEHLNDLLSAEIIERKRTEDQLRRYADEQAALVAVTSAASAFLEPDVLLSKILEVVIAIPNIKADVGWVLVLEEGRSGISHPGPVKGVSQEFVDVERAEPLYNCSICATWLEGTDLTGLPPTNAKLHLEPELLAKAGIQSHIVIPLSVSRRMLGVITLGWRNRRDDILVDRSLLLSIGRQVGLALRNAQLYQSAIKVNHLEAINKITSAAGSTLELDVVLQQVLEKACQTLDAETGAILLITPDAKDLAFAYILPGSLNIQSNRLVPAEQGILGWVVQYRQVARINDINRDPRTYRGLKPIFGPGIDSLICAPLVHRDKFTGIIAIFNKRYGEFNQEDANLLEAVSSISASALDNARLYEDLKQSLLEKERTQAQLVQSEKIAALGRLAASVAHEINNPLQAVQGCLSLLVEELSGPQRPDKMNSYLNIVDKEIERVAGIVHSMRDFARPAPQGTRSTDIISVLEDVLGLAGKQLQHSNISVERSWGVDVPTIQANPNLLKQVFLNMILNAIDAMSGGGALRVSAIMDKIKIKDNPLPQPAIRIEFSDTGPGMAPEAISRLFEPFFTTKEQGSGLGLYICYTIIQSLNGEIEANSTVGLGTTFAILVPINGTKE